MPEVDRNCYNCVHHSLCKYEPDWTHFPVKDESASNLWFHTVPKIIADICTHFNPKLIMEDSNG